MLSVNHLIVLSWAIILTDAGVSMHNPFYCYSQDPLRPQVGMFSIRTAYESIRGRSINPNVSTCTPSKFWMMSRHGTRWPNARELLLLNENSERLRNDILSNYDQGRTSLCASDVELIRNWRYEDWNITLEDQADLNAAGWSEMEGLGQRYQAAFPSILSPTYSANDYFFRTTGTHRTQTSLEAFADGVFGVNGHQQVQFENVPEQDFYLVHYELCPLYDNVTANFLVEQQAFREMPEYQEMTTQVSAKLGFHGSHALRNSDIEILDLYCMYEQIWNLNSTSTLCSAFSIANYQVLEYHAELNHYYRARPGNPDYPRLFENLNCYLLQDMLRFLQSDDINDHKVKIFNSHMRGLLFFVVALGDFEGDVQLTRHNFAQQWQRSWKASVIAGFAANVAVVRYE